MSAGNLHFRSARDGARRVAGGIDADDEQVRPGGAPDLADRRREHPPLDRAGLLAKRVEERESDRPPRQRSQRHPSTLLITPSANAGAGRRLDGHVAWPWSRVRTGSAAAEPVSCLWNAMPIVIPTSAAEATPAMNHRRCIRTRPGFARRTTSTARLQRAGREGSKQRPAAGRSGTKRPSHPLFSRQFVSAHRRAPPASTTRCRVEPPRNEDDRARCWGTEPGTHIPPAASCWVAQGRQAA